MPKKIRGEQIVFWNFDEVSWIELANKVYEIRQLAKNKNKATIHPHEKDTFANGWNEAMAVVVEILDRST